MAAEGIICISECILGFVTGGAENPLKTSVENGSGNKVKGSPARCRAKFLSQ